MYKKKRNDIDKLKTLFFGKDLRVTEGGRVHRGSQI